MSDKVEEFKTDIGHVKVDMKTKEITVDGQPLASVTTKSSLMALLLRDLSIDRGLMQAIHSNLTALQSWLPGIGNRQARDLFRKFITDTHGSLEGIIKQRNLQLITLIRAEKEWQKSQTAATPPSTLDALSIPPATSAPEAPKSPESASAT
jgi:hypothetical protein